MSSVLGSIDTTLPEITNVHQEVYRAIALIKNVGMSGVVGSIDTNRLEITNVHQEVYRVIALI